MEQNIGQICSVKFTILVGSGQYAQTSYPDLLSTKPARNLGGYEVSCILPQLFFLMLMAKPMQCPVDVVHISFTHFYVPMFIIIINNNNNNINNNNNNNHQTYNNNNNKNEKMIIK